MKITIDTKEDSPADIRKVIALLSTLAEKREHHSNIFEDSSPGLPMASSYPETPSSTESNPPSPSSGGGIFNMFGDSSSTSSSSTEKSDYPTLNAEDEEIPEKVSRIKTY